MNMFYLYHLDYARVLHKIVNKQGIHECFANEELAKHHASYYSLSGKYFAVVIEESSDLDNTRDGKPVEES